VSIRWRRTPHNASSAISQVAPHLVLRVGDEGRLAPDLAHEARRLAAGLAMMRDQPLAQGRLEDVGRHQHRRPVRQGHMRGGLPQRRDRGLAGLERVGCDRSKHRIDDQPVPPLGLPLPRRSEQRRQDTAGIEEEADSGKLLSHPPRRLVLRVAGNSEEAGSDVVEQRPVAKGAGQSLRRLGLAGAAQEEQQDIAPANGVEDVIVASADGLGPEPGHRLAGHERARTGRGGVRIHRLAYAGGLSATKAA
jgi:hypothetical protein